MTAFKARTVFLMVLVACAFAIIAARLFVIQILQGPHFAEESRRQTQQRAIVAARRGAILDRKGNPLAVSPQNRMKVDADMLQSQQQESGMGNDAMVTIKRLYPHGELAGTMLGYVGRDGGGLGGVEFYFDRFLKGEDGWTILRKDGKNHTYEKIGLPSNPPRNGSDVYLTVDLDIQKIVENALRRTVDSLGALGGMCLVMEPATGKILAMAGAPAFNPNLAQRYSLARRLNPCVNYTFEPGSTFKALTAACALQENVARETDTLNGNGGSYEIYNEKIHDEKPYGRLSFVEAFKYSSNVCFAKVANRLGNERLYRYALDFGFGQHTGVELPGEEAGVVHPVKKWSGRTRVTMAIGQEISVTIVQMARLFACIADGGVLVEPRLLEKVVGEDGAVVDSGRYRPVRRVISPGVAKRMTSMLCEVVRSGTGTRATINGVAVAGKTGTAQKIDRATGAYSTKRLWSSFIGFLPADNPLLLCAVIIDEPAGAQNGGVVAAPAFQEIMSRIISHPQLEYAEKILHRGQMADSGVRKGQPVPDVCGIEGDDALAMLKARGMSCELAGEGSGRIEYQVPAAGSCLQSDEKIVLHTRPAIPEAGPQGPSEAPDCIGADLRDAINAMNLRGIVPFANGAGIVRDQSLPGGSSVRCGQACTLFCSFSPVAQASGKSQGGKGLACAAIQAAGFPAQGSGKQGQ